MILKISKPGDALGLSAALNNIPHEVTAETLDPGTLMHIGRSAFLEFMETSAEASRNLAIALAREHREFVVIARRLALLPFASGRLARILIDFAADDPEPASGTQVKFKMMLTHGELASLAATSRETVTRLLNQFERAGILLRENSNFTILKSAELEKVACGHSRNRAIE
jgi:CRP/FNR family transcriptional regulator